MSQQQTEADVVLSLLRDVEQETLNISPDSPGGREAGFALIRGDLRLAHQQAASLSGPEGDHLRALCLYTEARLRAHIAGSEKTRQFKADLTEAAQLLEKAIGLSALPQIHSLLGALYADLGRFEEARRAWTTAAESGEGEVATEARKNLLRLKEAAHDAKDPAARLGRYLGKHHRSSSHFLTAVIAIVINLFIPWQIARFFIGFMAFTQICYGVYWFFKESFGRR